MRTFKPIGILTAEQHANLANANMCGCAECSEQEAIDGTISAIVGHRSMSPAFGDGADQCWNGDKR